MDLGIAGKRAIVGAASKGLGKGCAMALAEEGVHLTINARTAAELEATAAEIRAATGVEVAAVAGDITRAETRQAILAACPEPDILVTNAGGPPPGNFRTDTRERWLAALEAQLLGHAEMITAVVDGMAARCFGRIVNITSQSTKMPVPNLGLSTSARLALQGFCNTICREVMDRNVVINNLLPGPFDTDRLKSGITHAAQQAGIEVEAARAARMAATPAGRFGTAEEFGKVCAFLCSQHVGFMTANSVLMDGGLYPGTF
ncbi:MAG: SDR family oxidoreductase [Alphaproteobacteria bacterium]|nr:SDR family oxidoreductase [Alphaproteobacteria bacterium]